MTGRNYRRLTIILLLLFTLIQTVAALDFSSTVDPKGQTIKLNETARFTLSISNNGLNDQTFEIYSPDVQWDVATEPSKDRLIEVAGGQQASTTLVVRPLYVNPGLYVVGIIIKKSGTNEFIRKDLEVGITRDQPGEYAPSIRGLIDFSDDIDPRRNATLKLEIENQNRREIGDITIKIRSNLINDDISTKLGPLELKKLTLTYPLDPYTPPQKDALRVTAFSQWRNKTVQFDLIPHSFEIIPYGGINEKSDRESFLLAETRALRLTNVGNTPRTKTYKERMSLLQQWLTSTTPDPQLKQTEEGTFYIWNLELEPGEEATITIVENYRPLAYLGLLVIVLIVAFYFLRTPLLVRKAAMVFETKEGGISELKVLITIKNRSTAQLIDMEIVDRVPPIAEVKTEHEVGTLRPEQVLRHEHKGTQLRWKIDSLDPHEERILSYKIRTKLSVLGGLNLPPCRIGFKHFGYNRGTISNMENLFGGH